MIETLSTAALVTTAVAAAVIDVRTRRIPNLLVVSALVMALVLRAAQGPEALVAGLAGAAIALVAGFVLFAIGGFGGGDGKLMMALGAFLGPQHLLTAFVLMGVAGAVLAIAEAVRRRTLLLAVMNIYTVVMTRSTSSLRGLQSPGAVAVPYGVAIAVGAVGAVLLGG